MFRHCSPQACRLVLPRVCKQWAEVLREPNAAWKTIVLDRRPEVAALRNASGASAMFGVAAAAPAAAATPPLNVHALYWARQRALGVRHLAVGTLGLAPQAGANDVPNKTRWLHRLIDLAAPSLVSLAVGTAPRPEGYSLKWLDIHRVLPSKGLRSLAVRGIDDGPLSVTGVAPLASLPLLRELTLCWDAAGDTSALPDALFTLTALRRLSLSSRQLAGTLPRAITRLQRLEALVVENAHLSALPEELSRLSALTKLSLARNAGPALARPATWETLAWLPTLAELDVSGSNIHRLEALTAGDAFEAKDTQPFRSLERLDASGNALGPAPSLGMLSNDMYLKHLALNRCGLALIPNDSIPECEGLESLELADNALVDLPPALRQLHWLEHLNVAGNPFPAVPEAIRESDTLRRVDLRRCTYLEAATSLAGLVQSASRLEELKMDKEGAGVYQESTKVWLREAAAAFEAAGKGGVLTW